MGHNLSVPFYSQVVLERLTILGSVTSKRDADLIYIAAEASYYSWGYLILWVNKDS